MAINLNPSLPRRMHDLTPLHTWPVLNCRLEHVIYGIWGGECFSRWSAVRPYFSLPPHPTALLVAFKYACAARKKICSRKRLGISTKNSAYQRTSIAQGAVLLGTYLD